MSDKRAIPVSETPDPDSSPPVPENLGRRALAGVGWSYIATSITALGQIIYTVIMSRLLPPEAFGLIAMTVVARGVGSLLSRMGIGQALIQKSSLSDKEIRAGFTLGIVLGVFFFGLSWVLAPALAGLFDEARAVPVIRGASLALVVNGFMATPQDLMRRGLRFKEGALIHIVGFVISYFVIGVGSALAGAGVWALVYAPIAHSLIGGILSYARIRHPIRPTFDPSSYRALLSFGTRISLIGFGEFFGSQTDTIIVGRFAGTNLLGMYNRAFYLAVLPLEILMNTMSSILFASFSRIQTDLPRLKRAYLSSAKVSAALFFPVSAGIGAASHELIVVLLGERYREVAVVVPFFGVYAAMSKMSSLCGILLGARAELNKRLALQALYIAGLVGALLAVAGGPLWVYGAVLAGGEIVRNLAYNLLIFKKKIIPVDLWELFKLYVPGLTAAALVIVAMTATRAVVVDAMGLSPIIALVTEGAAATATLLLLVRRGSLSFLRNEILSRIPLDRAGSGRNRLLVFALRFLLGPSPEARS